MASDLGPEVFSLPSSHGSTIEELRAALDSLDVAVSGWQSQVSAHEDLWGEKIANVRHAIATAFASLPSGDVFPRKQGALDYDAATSAYGRVKSELILSPDTIFTPTILETVGAGISSAVDSVKDGGFLAGLEKVGIGLGVLLLLVLLIVVFK